MAYDNYNFEIYRNKFYCYSNNFHNFNNITQEQLTKIKLEIPLLLNELTNNFTHTIMDERFYIYQKTLEYLSNPCISQKYSSFDERILFLILAVDPNCDSYKLYVNNKLKDKHEITNMIRNKVGFFDNNILIYEHYYLQKYNIYTNSNIDYTNIIVYKAKELISFNNINDTQYQLLVNKVKFWNTFKNNLTNKDYSQNIFYSKLSIHEKIILLILCIDPNLKLLQIYQDECTINKLKERCLNEYGFYCKDLFRLEELYRERFCNSLTIDKWQKRK